jgi:hypothetical protein
MLSVLARVLMLLGSFKRSEPASLGELASS